MKIWEPSLSLLIKSNYCTDHSQVSAETVQRSRTDTLHPQNIPILNSKVLRSEYIWLP